MSDRMTDERLAALSTFGPYPYHAHLELHAGMVAERAEVDRLGGALDLCQDIYGKVLGETSEVLIECNRLEGRVVRLEAALTDLAAAHELVGLIAARHVLTVHASPVKVTADVATIDEGLAVLARAEAVLAEGATT